MTGCRLLWHDYKYFPYERSLALREVEILGGAKPHEVMGGLVVDGISTVDRLRRLTYFKGIDAPSGQVVPDQAVLEASSLVNGHRWSPDFEPFPSLRRQSTRYSAHGLHEYRGKFHPQIVRAIGNLLEIEPGDWVLDPFCGSGTTLLEAAHIGWNAIGIDINPLAVMIANAKLAAFCASPSVLSRECKVITERLAHDGACRNWRSHLPEPDYLEKWFPVPVLEQLCAILHAIEHTRPKVLQNVFRVVLSDICRDVSLQDPDDLRIRRRKNPAENYPATKTFLDAIQTRIASVIEARMVVQPKSDVRQLAAVADTRKTASAVLSLASPPKGVFDAAITSPPYATAMPYLDTQRLSLALFGLLGSRDLRSGEKTLIGNREIGDKERLELQEHLLANAAHLPDAAAKFCARLLRLADHADHGFRRRNVPALAYKYLSDMSVMFESVRKVVRPRGPYALLVGRNSTCLRGEQVMIDTPQLLAGVAESRGWEVSQMLPFETYHRYDLHQNNSIREEVLVILRAK